ncbi:hypothetical protein [uncultured Mucilaginibacter sp.]|nr:hypothetical protein [uncultured Mucilaginibacter sp.]
MVLQYEDASFITQKLVKSFNPKVERYFFKRFYFRSFQLYNDASFIT